MRKKKEIERKLKKLRLLLKIVSSVLILFPGFSLAQYPAYYVDTLDIGSFKQPLIIEFISSDTLYYYNPFGGIVKEAYSYDRRGDTIRISNKENSYTTYFRGDTLCGTFIIYDISMLKVDSRPSSITRPQLPQMPLPYTQKDVRFKSNLDSIYLSGTLTLPQQMDDNTPCLVFVSGSGAQDRNESMLNHKPFLVLADYLARHGIASLRYDDRGVGESEGNFVGSTINTFAQDAAGALKYLHQLHIFSAIGLLGHSEGAMVASQLCRNPDNADFYILIGAPAVAIDTLMYVQSKLVMQSMDMKKSTADATLAFNMQVYKLLQKDISMDSLPEYLDPLIKEFRNSLDSTERNKPENSAMRLYFKVASTFSNDYMHSFFTFPADKNFTYMQDPVLAIYGGKDVQVPADLNAPALNKQLEKAPTDSYKIITFPDCNHLMQTATTGSPAEYIFIETTIEPKVLKTIGEWIENLDLKHEGMQQE